jgi:glycosyltransferase involved in cell wall biosynthesis
MIAPQIHNTQGEGIASNSCLVTIPVFNEEETIAEVVRGIRECTPDVDILVINDGSTDNTASIVKQAGVMMLSFPFNIGYGGAVQTGFRFAAEYGYRYVITMDGDGQHDPSSVKNLIVTAEETGADIVIGSRFLRGNYRMSLFRRMGVWLFSKIARWYTGMSFTDPTSGFQILNRRVFSYLAEGDNYPLDYPDVNIIMALHKMRFRLAEAPVTMIEKPKGKSMHNGLKPLYYVLRMTLAIIMVLLRKED